MNIDDENKLIELLEKFFNEVDLNKRNELNKNKVADYLKNKLKGLGLWKSNKGRGKYEKEEINKGKQTNEQLKKDLAAAQDEIKEKSLPKCKCGCNLIIQKDIKGKGKTIIKCEDEWCRFYL